MAGDMTADGANQYAYDDEGRVCAVQAPPAAPGWPPTMVQYIYDAEDQRVAKGTIHAVLVNGQPTLSCDTTQNGFTLTNSYGLDLAGEQVTETGGDGQWLHTNVFVGGQLLATYDPNGLHSNITDWLGTRRVQTNISGEVEETYQNLPFGELVPQNNTFFLGATEHHFTGKEIDAESGNDYMFARYYNSATGRFLSPDWSAKEDPVPYAHLDNPQSLNLYSYVQNNPLAKPDLDGHGCPPDCGDPTAPAAVAPPPPSLWDRFVDANVAVLHYAAVQYDELTHPTRNCPNCSMQIVPLGMPDTPGILQNAAKGKAFQEGVAAATAKEIGPTVQNITLKTESGAKTVMDVAAKDSSGTVVLREAKSSATARLTPGQAAAHPEIEQTGVTVMGKGKPGFSGGTTIPPTKVQVVRPDP